MNVPLVAKSEAARCNSNYDGFNLLSTTQCKLPVFISIYKRTGYGFDRSIKAVLTIFESFKIHILYIDFAKVIQTTNIK